MSCFIYDKKIAYRVNYERTERIRVFPRRLVTQPGKNKPTPTPENRQLEKQIVQDAQKNLAIPELVNTRTPVRSIGKRIITRNSFEIYEDQMDALRKLSIEEKMAGNLGSISEMVREAIDTYLHKKS